MTAISKPKDLKPLTEEDVKEQAERLSLARSRLMLKAPFFAQLVMRLRTTFTEQVPTAGVDGVNLLINPRFWASLDPTEIQFVLCHEIMHCVLLHHLRRGARDPLKWNLAADHAVNLLLNDMGYPPPDKHVDHICFDKQWAEMTAETIYDRLPDPPTIQVPMFGGDVHDRGQLGDEEGDGQGVEGQEGDGDEAEGGIRPKQEPGSEDDWRTWTVAAAEAQRSKGDLPQALGRLIKDLTDPVMDWKALLAMYLVRANDEFSWARPNRRYVGQGLHLPIRHSEAMGDIAVSIDCSGSVSDEELAQFLSELNMILNGLRPSRLIVMQVDCEVQSVREYTREQLPVRMKLSRDGYGGTSFKPPFRKLEEMAVRPECHVYLTDMEGDFPEPPSYPTLWINVQPHGAEAPFGRTAFFPRGA